MSTEGPETGDRAKLNALATGFRGLDWVSRVYLVTEAGIAVWFAGGACLCNELGTLGLLVAVAWLALIPFGVQQAGRIGLGLGLGGIRLFCAELLFAFVLLCVGGIPVLWLLQIIAAIAMRKRYGVKSGIFGLNSRSLNNALSEMEAQDS